MMIMEVMMPVSFEKAADNIVTNPYDQWTV